MNMCFWGIIKRLGKVMTFLGTDMDMSRPPTTDELLDVVAKKAGTSIEELRPHELGIIREGEPQYAIAGSGDARLIFDPPEILAEMEGVGAPRTPCRISFCTMAPMRRIC